MNKITPTEKQQKAFQNVVENGGNVSRGMKDAGYSKNTASTPQKLTESRGWEELVEEYLPDQKINEKISEGLEANKQLAARVIFRKDAPTSQSAGELPLASSTTDDFIEVPDFAVRHKYVETALKVKGRFIEKTDITSGGETLAITFVAKPINEPDTDSNS